MEDSTNPHTSESNEAVPQQQPTQEATIEEGSLGTSAPSPETVGLEFVEGYEYNFGTGQELSTGEDEEVSEADTEKLTKKVQESDQKLYDAWYGSYDDNPMDARGLEVVIDHDDRVQITATTKFPWRAICSLRMKSKTGKSFIGTGWFVSPRTIITAGHCVYFHNEGGWAKEITVMPGRNGNSLPYGSCVARSYRSVTGWTRDKGRNFDYGAIILPTNCRLGARTGYFGYAHMGDSSLRSKYLNLSGYPGDKPSGTQWFHSRRVKGVSDRTIKYEIDTAGGQSGSPVWYINNGNRYAAGIHTNGHSSGNSATRIVKSVFDNIKYWKSLGM